MLTFMEIPNLAWDCKTEVLASQPLTFRVRASNSRSDDRIIDVRFKWYPSEVNGQIIKKLVEDDDMSNLHSILVSKDLSQHWREMT